ncbi:MAG: phosphoesterase [Herpetosiphonaceae bacterium]|nr:MAG: phosphoesterase [Herpetosiphonaceae bacterium]
MIYDDVRVAAPLIAERLRTARHILVLTHVHPDGDAAGSLIAMGHVLQGQGYRVTLVAPTALPSAASVLASAPAVHIYVNHRTLPEDVDRVVILDTGSIDRLGPIFTEQKDYLLRRPMIVIDHHVTNEGQGTINLIVPQASATCELLHDLFHAWGTPIDPETATALLLGLITDTQSYQTSSTTPHSLLVGSQLLAAGGDLARLINAIYFSKSFANMRAVGMALARIERDEDLIWTELTREMIEATGADDEASDELMMILARIAGAKAYALFKERPDGTIKVSLRSHPGVDVAAVAARFGGGGHIQASGATLHVPLAEAREAVLAALHDAVRRAVEAEYR